MSNLLTNIRSIFQPTLLEQILHCSVQQLNHFCRVIVTCFVFCLQILHAQDFSTSVFTEPLMDQFPATKSLASINFLPVGMAIFDTCSFYAVPGSIGVEAVIFTHSVNTPSIEQSEITTLPADEPATRMARSLGIPNTEGNTLSSATASTLPQTNSSPDIWDDELVWRANPPCTPWSNTPNNHTANNQFCLFSSVQSSGAHSRSNGHYHLQKVFIDFHQVFPLLFTPSIDENAVILYWPAIAALRARGNSASADTVAFRIRQSNFLFYSINRPPPGFGFVFA